MDENQPPIQSPEPQPFIRLSPRHPEKMKKISPSDFVTQKSPAAASAVSSKIRQPIPAQSLKISVPKVSFLGFADLRIFIFATCVFMSSSEFLCVCSCVCGVV